MAGSVALAKCNKCVRLRQEYEHATAVRLQAEADFQAAVYSGSSAIVQSTRQTATSSLGKWMQANADLNRHAMSHAVGEPESRHSSEIKARRAGFSNAA
jgi:hypothetical protein